VIVVIVVSQLLGVDLTGLLGRRRQRVTPAAAHHHDTASPPTGPDSDTELVDFVKFVMRDIQDTFEGMYRAEGKPYRRAKLVLLTRAIDTGCGRSSSAIGPFYCPADEHAYIDLSFYRDLKRRFGASGDFAQAYVLAHEIGHHLQKLSGIEARAARLGRDRISRVGAPGAAGRLLRRPVGALVVRATAATAIGDDRLQRQAGREVNPETFTHGTSAQRVRWFRRGFDSGRFDACDTFSAATL
jgi:predicted metalloprotease